MFKSIYLWIFFILFLFSSCNKLPPSNNDIVTDTIPTNLVLTYQEADGSLQTPIVFTATVTPTTTLSNRPLAGTVKFTATNENGNDYSTGCIAQQFDGAQASCPIVFTQEGTYTVKAYYSGQENIYQPSENSVIYKASKMDVNIQFQNIPSGTVKINTNYPFNIILTRADRKLFALNTPVPSVKISVLSAIQTLAQEQSLRTGNSGSCSKQTNEGGQIILNCSFIASIPGEPIKIEAKISDDPRYADNSETETINVQDTVLNIELVNPSSPLHIKNSISLVGKFTIANSTPEMLQQLTLKNDTKFEEYKNGQWSSISCDVQERYETTEAFAECDFTPESAFENRNFRINYNEFNSNSTYYPKKSNEIDLTVTKFPIKITLSHDASANPSTFYIGDTVNFTASLEGAQSEYTPPTPSFKLCNTNGCQTYIGCGQSSQTLKSNLQSSSDSSLCKYNHMTKSEDIPSFTFQAIIAGNDFYEPAMSNTETISVATAPEQLLITSPHTTYFDKTKKIYTYKEYVSEAWQLNPTEEIGKIKIQATGTWFNKNISEIPNNELTLSLDSVDVLEDSNFYTKGTVIASGSKNFPTSCVRINSVAGQALFACKMMPLVREAKYNFTLKYKHDGQEQSQADFVIINFEPTQKTFEAPSSGCGLHGTLQQRVFDCSMKMTQSSGHVYDNIFIENGDAKDLWFILRCPKGKTDRSKCTWLSPTIMRTWYYANQYLSFNPTDNISNDSPWAIAYYEGGRILWSGNDATDRTFEEVNPNVYYSYVLNWGGQVRHYDSYTALTPGKFGEDPCHGNMKDYGWEEEEFTGAMWLPKPDTLSSSSSWLVPSYVQLLLITGQSCIGSDFMGDVDMCDGRGFGAYKMPGFGSGALWSSEKSYDLKSIFNGNTGYIDRTDKNNAQLRCALMFTKDDLSN